MQKNNILYNFSPVQIEDFTLKKAIKASMTDPFFPLYSSDICYKPIREEYTSCLFFGQKKKGVNIR